MNIPAQYRRAVVYPLCGEIYILGFDVRQPGLAMRAVVQWVLDGRLPFDWNDAARVSREIVAIAEEACKGK